MRHKYIGLLILAFSLLACAPFRVNGTSKLQPIERLFRNALNKYFAEKPDHPAIQRLKGEKITYALKPSLMSYFST